MREWSGGGGIFLPHSLPGLQPGLPPFNQAFCPMAPAPGIQLCLCSIILCSSLCPCKIRVVSLPLFLVSGCLDTHVYLPNQVIPSWVPLVLPGPWWHIIFMSSSLWLLFMDGSSCIRHCSIQKASYYFTNEKIDLAIWKILSQVTQLVSGRVGIQTVLESLFKPLPTVLQHSPRQNPLACLLQIQILRNLLRALCWGSQLSVLMWAVKLAWGHHPNQGS